MRNFFFLKLLFLGITATLKVQGSQLGGDNGNKSNFYDPRGTNNNHKKIPPRFQGTGQNPYYAIPKGEESYYYPLSEPDNDQLYGVDLPEPDNNQLYGVDLYNDQQKINFLQLTILGLQRQIRSINQYYQEANEFFKKHGGLLAYYQNEKQRLATHKADILDYQLEVQNYQTLLKDLREALKDTTLSPQASSLLTHKNFKKKPSKSLNTRTTG